MPVIVFDLGGVLVNWDPHFVYQRYFNCEKKVSDFFKRTEILEVNKSLDKGAAFAVELEKLAAKFPDDREAIFMWQNQWADMIRGSIAESVNILTQLYHAGYPLYGLTNWSHETFPYALANFKFLNYFRDIVVSGQVKAIKPELEIFHILMHRNHLLASECIFIDDSLANVEAAESLGFQGIHFQTPEVLVEKLTALNIL